METSTKAKKRIDASIDGYDKHHLIQEQDAEKKTLQVLKKNELIEKRQKLAKKEYKDKVTILTDTMNKKFENVAKAKITCRNDYNEKLEKIHERRS